MEGRGKLKSVLGSEVEARIFVSSVKKKKKKKSGLEET